MMLYLIKVILCSALLLAGYFLLFEKEKMHRFNRFYLLLSIVTSFIIPLITLPVEAEIFPVTETMAPLDIAVFDALEIANSPTQQITTLSIAETRNWWPAALIALYLTISLMLLFRFLRNLIKIITSIRQNEIINYLDAKLVLTNHQQVPHTFLQYVFLHKNDYENGQIEKEMLCHEMVHVRQKHSLDVLFIEVLLIVCWFNPVLYFYRKAIRLNHEFLADDAVVATFQNPVNYQQLLLLSASRPGSLLPASPFNYSITKKRLIMMTRNTSPKIAFAKQIAVLPFVAAMVLLFSTKAIAQQDTEKPGLPQDTNAAKGKVQSFENIDSSSNPGARVSVGSTKEGVTPDLLMEYANIINKYETEGKWWHTFSKRVNEQDKKRLETIFKEMSLKQQRIQFLTFFKTLGALPRAVPTSEQFAAFKNPKVYGVWINDKHVTNTALNNYTNTDFAQFTVSKLYGVAKPGRNYTHQLTMMTKDYYQNYYNQTMADKKGRISFLLNNHPVDSIRQKFKVSKILQMEEQKIQDSMYRDPNLLGMIPLGLGAYDNEMDQYNNTLKRVLSLRMTPAGETEDVTEVLLSRLARIYYRMNESQRNMVIESTKRLIMSL